MTAWAWVRVTAALVARPALWPTAVRQAARLAAPGWWRRAPFLPIPPRAYRRLRLLTQYGDEGHAPEPRDVLHYMVWCRQWQAGSR